MPTALLRERGLIASLRSPVEPVKAPTIERSRHGVLPPPSGGCFFGHGVNVSGGSVAGTLAFDKLKIASIFDGSWSNWNSIAEPSTTSEFPGIAAVSPVPGKIYLIAWGSWDVGHLLTDRLYSSGSGVWEFSSQICRL